MTRITRFLLVLLFMIAGYTGALSKNVVLYDEDEDTQYYYDDGVNNLYYNIFGGFAINEEDAEGNASLGLNFLYTTTPVTAFGLSLGIHDPMQSYEEYYYDEDGYSDGWSDCEKDFTILEAGAIGRIYMNKIPESIFDPFLHFGVSLNLYKYEADYEYHGQYSSDGYIEKDWTGNIGLEAGAGFLLLEHLEFSIIYRTSSAANFFTVSIGCMF